MKVLKVIFGGIVVTAICFGYFTNISYQSEIEKSNVTLSLLGIQIAEGESCSNLCTAPYSAICTDFGTWGCLGYRIYWT